MWGVGQRRCCASRGCAGVVAATETALTCAIDAFDPISFVSSCVWWRVIEIAAVTPSSTGTHALKPVATSSVPKLVRMTFVVVIKNFKGGKGRWRVWGVAEDGWC